MTCGCTRKSWNLKEDELCCPECGKSNGTQHNPNCDLIQECIQRATKWREALRVSMRTKLANRFVLKATDHPPPGNEGYPTTNNDEVAEEALVNTAALEEALLRLDPACWTKERVGELFRVLSIGVDGNIKEDGKVQFSELMTWCFCCYKEKDLTSLPCGEGTQNLVVRAKAADGGTPLVKNIAATVPGWFKMKASKATTWGQLAEILSIWLGLPSESVIFTACDDLSKQYTDYELSIEKSGIKLPGPMAMKRQGGKAYVDLYFDVKESVLTTAPAALINHLDDEIRLKLDDVKARKLDATRSLEIAAKEEAARLKRENVDKELDEFVSKNIGISKLEWDALSEEERKHTNYLVEETSEAAKAIISGLIARPVIRLYRNVNETLMFRYERGKERLKTCGRTIKMEETQTQKAISGHPPLDNGGPYDPSINEYPMWHGTGRAGVAGITKNNFDIRFAGTHGLVYGTGFYHADAAATSAGYAGMGGSDYVNDKYPRIAYMLLNRVMCGNIKHFGREAMDRKEFDMWTADCIGSGGKWAGKDAKYECIKSGGNFCWVAVHPDQVYPAYLILYSP